MAEMIDKLKCWVMGHKRGKRVTDFPVVLGQAGFRCPRCRAVWYRKVKA